MYYFLQSTKFPELVFGCPSVETWRFLESFDLWASTLPFLTSPFPCFWLWTKNVWSSRSCPIYGIRRPGSVSLWSIIHGVWPGASLLTFGGLSSLSVRNKDDLAKLWQGIKAQSVNLKHWEPPEHLFIPTDFSWNFLLKLISCSILSLCYLLGILGGVDWLFFSPLSLSDG